MSLYDRGRATASRLLEQYAQGTVIYNEPGSTGGDPWNPTPGASTPYPVNTTKMQGREKNQYIEGGYIVSSDVLLFVAVFDVEPTLSGTMTINGQEHQIVMVNPVTNVQPPMGWHVGCRA